MRINSKLKIVSPKKTTTYYQNYSTLTLCISVQTFEEFCSISGEIQFPHPSWNIFLTSSQLTKLGIFSLRNQCFEESTWNQLNLIKYIFLWEYLFRRLFPSESFFIFIHFQKKYLIPNLPFFVSVYWISTESQWNSTFFGYYCA